MSTIADRRVEVDTLNRVMRVTWQSRNYSPDKVTARYVRAAGQQFRVCEVGPDRIHDIRQGFVEASGLPSRIRKAACKLGCVFSYTAWKL